MARAFEILGHTADVRIRAWGDSQEALFENMMRGMFAAMAPQPQRNDANTGAKKREPRNLKATGPDKEALLVDFLNEVLYLADTHQEVYTDAVFAKLSETELDAQVFGKKRLRVALQVKAATYHGLHITTRDGIYEAEVIFDI